MDIIELQNKLARLESVNDQLMAELDAVDSLMRSIGFTYGLVSVKAVAEELLEVASREEEECGN